MSKPSFFKFWTGGVTAQHSEVSSEPNADCFFHASNYIGVLDGVSGVTEYGLRPEALSHEVAQWLEFFLSHRFHPGTDKTATDRENARLSEEAEGKKVGWLRNILTLSVLRSKALGATTLGVATVSSNKLNVLSIGDVISSKCHSCYNSSHHKILTDTITRVITKSSQNHHKSSKFQKRYNHYYINTRSQPELNQQLREDGLFCAVIITSTDVAQSRISSADAVPRSEGGTRTVSWCRSRGNTSRRLFYRATLPRQIRSFCPLKPLGLLFRAKLHPCGSFSQCFKRWRQSCSLSISEEMHCQRLPGSDLAIEGFLLAGHAFT